MLNGIYRELFSNIVMVEDKQVSFKLSLEEYEEAVRIDSITSHAGKISNDSVAAIAKACLFMRINEWKNIEAMQKAIEERDEALKSHNLPQQGFGYL